VPNGSPETIVTVLRSAQSAVPDPRLEATLEGFRREWLGIGRRRYPALGADIEDAVQGALLKLVSPDKLAHLKDPARVAPWARSIFVNEVIDLVRDLKRRQSRRAELGGVDEHHEDVLRERVPSLEPTPEEAAMRRQRLAVIARCVGQLEVARLRFVDDLPEKEIAERLQLTRDGVAGQLKRIRKALRTALGEEE